MMPWRSTATASQPLALKPEALREEMLRQKLGDELMQQELASGDWLPSRAAADMKGGLAIGLYELLTLPENAEIGVLFVAVCDEKMSPPVCAARSMFYWNSSDALRSTILPRLFGAAASSWPVRNSWSITAASARSCPSLSPGESSPTAVSRSRGSTLPIWPREITARIDMNTDLVTEDFGLSSPPPAVQQMRDPKTTYDVSLPSLAAVCVNLLFLGGRARRRRNEKIRTMQMKRSLPSWQIRSGLHLATERDLLPESEKLHAAPARAFPL